MKEKQLYAIIIMPALALTVVTTYLFAVVLPYTQRLTLRYEELQAGAVYPVRRLFQEEAGFRTITVVGLGRASAKPNLVELRLGAMSEAVTATEALEESADSVNGVIEALKGMGIPGEDIEALCREAALNGLRRDINTKEVTPADFQKAGEKIKPTILPDIEAWYKGFMKQVRRVKKPTTPVA